MEEVLPGLYRVEVPFPVLILPGGGALPRRGVAVLALLIGAVLLWILRRHRGS